MREKLFHLEKINPNHAALVVPQEEGGSDDDTYFGSIGDATQCHIQSLTPSQRQMWEDLITMKDGNVFRSELSPAWHDPDPFNLQGKDLDDYFEELKHTVKKGLPGVDADQVLAPIREAFEQEAERRRISEDIYDNAELMPYDTLQDNPGMMKHVEVPSAPPDRLCYMGNTTQIFSDAIPEGHPHFAFINNTLQILNRDWDAIDENFAEWFKDTYLQQQAPSPDIYKAFSWLVDTLVEGKKHPLDATEQALLYLDSVWGLRYCKTALQSLEQDPVYSLIMRNKKDWEAAAKQGVNVYPDIKKFGQMLFTNFREQMRSHHWNLYKKLKKQYANRVFIRGVDVNRCDLSQLHWLFGNNARKAWTLRPFESVNEIHNKGLLSAAVFADNEEMEVILAEMDQKFAEAKQTYNGQTVALYRNRLIQQQKEDKTRSIDWNPVWSYYNMLKTELHTILEAHRKEQSNDHR